MKQRIAAMLAALAMLLTGSELPAIAEESLPDSGDLIWEPMPPEEEDFRAGGLIFTIYTPNQYTEVVKDKYAYVAGVEEGVTSVTIPAEADGVPVEGILDEALKSAALQEILVVEEQTHCSSVDGVLFNKAGDTLGYTDYQKVLLAAQVAQKIPYKTDIESRGVVEYPKYPYETFYDGCGDCEDKSIILAGILHDMNYAVALLHFSNHMAVGISGGSGIYGQYYTISGSSRRYFYIESTNFGSKIGECPAELKNELPKVYLLNFD